MEWISITDKQPTIKECGYSDKVLVCRPNKYSGKVDILTAHYHMAKQEGQEYGASSGFGHGYRITYGEYWSLPAITLKYSITHWLPLPKIPIGI